MNALLKSLIAALRAETRQDTISPESLGAILDKIVDEIDGMSAISPLERLATLESVTELPDPPTYEQQHTVYLISNQLYAYTEGRWQVRGQLQGPKGDKGDKGDPGTYIDPANIEVMNSLSSLDGKTTAQKQSMVPDGNTVEEIVSSIDDKQMELQKLLFPSLHGTTRAEVGLTAVATSKLTISAAGVVATSTASGYTNYRVAYITQPFSKGDIYYQHSENGSSSSGYIKRLCFGWTETDPSTLSSLVGLQLYYLYDKQATIQDVYLQCPYETGYLVFFYYNHSTAWQSAANRYSVWRNNIKDKQDKLTFDLTPELGSNNPVTSEGIRLAIGEVEQKLYGDLPILSIQQNKCIDWNASYSTNGSWRSGYTNAHTYIFDVSQYRGKNIQCHYWNRANTYPYAFVRDWEEIAFQESAETNGWAENAVLKPSSRNSTTGHEYNTIFMPTTI